MTLPAPNQGIRPPLAEYLRHARLLRLFRRKIWLLAGPIASFAMTLVVAHAYTLTGYNQGTINPLVVCNSNYYSPDSTAWADALTGWYNTSTPFTYQQNCNADVASLSDTTNSGVAWDGQTQIWQSGGLISFSASLLNRHWTDSYGSYERQSVASHELGHVLGLGELTGAYAVMNQYTCGVSYSRFCWYTIWGPQTDDVNGVNAIY